MARSTRTTPKNPGARVHARVVEISNRWSNLRVFNESRALANFFGWMEGTTEPLGYMSRRGRAPTFNDVLHYLEKSVEHGERCQQGEDARQAEADKEQLSKLQA